MERLRPALQVVGALISFLMAACNGGGSNPAPAMPQGPMPGSQTMASRTASVQTSSAVTALSSQFNEPGNYVVSDQFNNRVIEIDPPSHGIVWHFGDGSAIAGPHTAVGVNDAERVGRFTLISGTGVPAASPPFEPGCTAGCPDNRVMLVNAQANIVWQYGQAGVTGGGHDQLNTPVQATFTPNGHVLIADQGNQRIIEVNLNDKILFQYGTTGVAGNGPDHLNNPNSVESLGDGNLLIADESNNRVIEINHSKQIVWQYPKPTDTSLLNGAAFASRLPNGDTLITDGGNNRIIEIDSNKNVVWNYSTLAAGGNAAPAPSRAVELRDGNILISDQFNDRVILVHKTGPTSGTILFTQGMLNEPGDGFNMLDGPYDAKAVGDFTGLTPPPFGDAMNDNADPVMP